jgi:hypothetical protein
MIFIIGGAGENIEGHRQADLISGELGGFLTITQGFPLDAKIKAQFKANGKKTAIQAIAIAVGNLADDPDAKLTEPQLVNDAAHDGYEGYSLQSRSQDKDAGKTRFTQYVIILTADRADVIMRVAYDSQANYAAFNAGFESLATSIEPKNSGAPPPARLAAALPTDLAAITPKPKPAPAQSASAGGSQSKGGGRNCRVTQYRQQCALCLSAYVQLWLPVCSIINCHSRFPTPRRVVDAEVVPRTS